MNILFGTALAAVAGAALAIQPVQAQKSKNTLRTAFTSPIKGVSYYLDPKPDTAMEQGAVYDGLVWYNGETKKIEPLLAKSWKRIDAKTIEFVLRDDVKWHDGEAFDADDVVYTYNWLTDKKTRMRFKRNWAWVAKTEKLGQFKVRITAKKPTPFDMVRHATLTAIMPQHVHGPLPKKLAFGQKPVGTGMFKVTQVDANKGIIMELNPAFKHGGPGKPVTNVNRIHFAFIPDIGTQVAQFLAGNLDAMRNAPLDQAMSMAKAPGVELTVGASISYQYVAIDAKGRSGNKPLLDLRVRKAIMMAIDKDALVKLAAGPFKIVRPDAMCWRIQAGCDFSVDQPKFDPAAAKRLLAEAGHSNGFKVELTTFVSPAIRGSAEAISGMLSKVGITATVDARQIQSYRKKQRDGKIQIMVGGWPAGAMADVAGTLGFLFRPPPSRDYHGDATLKKMARAMSGIMDPAARRAQGRKVFNRVIEQQYFMTLMANPTSVVHTSDVTVKIGSLNAFAIEAWDFRWK